MINQSVDEAIFASVIQLSLVTESVWRLPGMDMLIASANDSSCCRIEIQNSTVQLTRGETYLNIRTTALALNGRLKSITDDSNGIDSAQDSVACWPFPELASDRKTKMAVMGSHWNTDADSCLGTMEFHVKVSVKEPSDSAWTESLSECCRGYYHVFKDTTLVDSVIKIDCPKKK